MHSAIAQLISFPRRQLWKARIRRWGIGYPDPEMRALAVLCHPGRLSIDVGAAQGAYTLHLLARSGAVWAFEPRAEARIELGRLFAKSPLVLSGAALSDRDGEATFTHCTAEPGRSTLALSNPIGGTREAIPVRTLDALDPPRVGFMKIDVEGHEEAVVRGAMETVKRDRPNLFIEIEERHAPGATSRLPTMLTELGYAGYYLLGQAWRPIGEFRAERDQRVGSTPYINNFIFVHRSSGIRASQLPA